ncbi:hypothetical protein EVAR_37716_1 [Eumeta japonica]|uniref:Uncharacterized protein n=1 Tax=Eumeta variegata TaxID=151549 RepID=A0A4C1YNX3_EUMVA|nr:hypothetical protein EVAR_37716_1 [Eumeta japonica]
MIHRMYLLPQAPAVKLIDEALALAASKWCIFRSNEAKLFQYLDPIVHLTLRTDINTTNKPAPKLKARLESKTGTVPEQESTVETILESIAGTAQNKDGEAHSVNKSDAGRELVYIVSILPSIVGKFQLPFAFDVVSRLRRQELSSVSPTRDESAPPASDREPASLKKKSIEKPKAAKPVELVLH